MDDPTVTSPYVETLEAQRAHLVSALAPHVTPALVESSHRRSARLSVRLDASPLDDATADAVDRGQAPQRPVATAHHPAHRGWAGALKLVRLAPLDSQRSREPTAQSLEGMPTQDIAAIEYGDLRASQRDEPRWADVFFAAPLDVLAAIERRIVAGLVAVDTVATLRRTSRAVSDGAQGRMLFHAPEPQHLPGLLAELDGWIRGARGRHGPLVIAGVVHLRLAHWHPFEAGNGRVARTASRVALRATRGDPWGLAVPEEVYADDPVGYSAEIAASIRRRTDLRPWIERTAEAVVASLEQIARQVGAAPPAVGVGADAQAVGTAVAAVPARGLRECERLDPGATITVVEYAAAVDIDRRAALAQLNRLCWTGLLWRDVGTHGLRYVRQAGHRVR